jgi:hypothetical protein
MLRLGEQCKALETERERVLSFFNDQPVGDVQQAVAQRKERQILAAQMMQTEGVDEKHLVETFGKQYNSDLQMLRQDGQAEEWSLLENFWRKHNKVLLDNAAINQEKFHLQNENAKLRSLLKQYLDGITVNEDVMNMRNNLLMTTTFANTTVGEKTDLHKTVIEANVVVSNAQKQRAGLF